MAAVSAVSSITDVTTQNYASNNDKIITCENAQSSNTGIVNTVNETREQDGVNASSDGHTRTRTCRYSDATVLRIAY